MAAEPTTAATTNAPLIASEDCSVCLEALTVSEQVVYPLPCQSCDYNYCSRCVVGFCRAADDDFQLASDGSRQVKVSVACPQCRSRYPMDLLDVVLLRRAHDLGCSMMRDGRLLADCDLSATQLSWKRDFVASSTRTQLRQAQGLYAHVMTRRPDLALVEKEEQIWKQLMERLPAEEDEDAGGEEFGNVVACGSAGSGSTRSGGLSGRKGNPGGNKKPSIDDTLFQGLEDFVNRDEKIFLTELFTSGVVRDLAQAAMIMHGVLRLSSTGKAAAIAKSHDLAMSKHEVQKVVEFIAQTKVSFPLPAHMPGYFLIPAYSPRDGFMVLKDKDWDGSIKPPQRSQRIFDDVYGKYYSPPQAEYPQRVVAIHSVRGPVGRVGLRKGDVITHVNEIEWKGTAEELQNYIYECHASQSHEEISLTLNSNPETARFLQVRREMMQRSL